MPCFCQNTVIFGQNAVFLRFYNNILFLISISWSLLCDFNTKMFTFASATKESVLYDRDVIVEICI